MEQLTFDLPAQRSAGTGRRTKGRVDSFGRECSSCQEYKPWSDYDLASTGHRGHDSMCKKCKGDRARTLRTARASRLPAEDRKPPTSGCKSSQAQYTAVIPLQYGIYVYRCWSADDRCIYVGKTKHALRRLGAHALTAWWRDVHHVDVAVMPTAEAAEVEEIAQIRHWMPVNNSAYNRTFARKSTKPQPTHCPHDHEYTDSNTLYNANGSKVCRECKNSKARAKRTRKGVAQGERVASAKLTAAAAADIRRRHALGQTISELARDYGVVRTSIRNVIDGSTWVHVREDRDEPEVSLRQQRLVAGAHQHHARHDAEPLRVGVL